MENRTKKLTPLLLTLVLCISVGSVAAILYYSMTKTAAINIVLNSYQIELFVDAECTIVADTIEFPNAMYGQPGVIRSSTYCLKAVAIEPGQTIVCKWSCDDLPAGMELRGYFWIVTYWEEWNDVADLVITDADPIIEVEFRLDVGSNDLGAYAFTVQFDAGD